MEKLVRKDRSEAEKKAAELADERADERVDERASSSNLSEQRVSAGRHRMWGQGGLNVEIEECFNRRREGELGRIGEEVPRLARPDERMIQITTINCYEMLGKMKTEKLKAEAITTMYDKKQATILVLTETGGSSERGTENMRWLLRQRRTTARGAPFRAGAGGGQGRGREHLPDAMAIHAPPDEAWATCGNSGW